MGYKLFTLLVGVLLVSLLAVFVVNVADEAKAKKKASDMSAPVDRSRVQLTGTFAHHRVKDFKAQS